MVNGRDSRLDLSNLERLILGGHTYIKTALTDTDEKNVMMGESIAVKSNQLIYLLISFKSSVPKPLYSPAKTTLLPFPFNTRSSLMLVLPFNSMVTGEKTRQSM